MYQYISEERSYNLYRPFLQQPCRPQFPCPPQPAPPCPPCFPCCCEDLIGPPGPTGPTSPTGPSGTGVAAALSATYSSNQNPAAGAALNFDINQTVLGTAISHVPGTSDFTISEAGTYLITYSATVTGAAAAAYPLTASAALRAGSTTVLSSASSTTLTAAANSAVLAKTLILPITSAATFTLINLNADAIYTNATFTIVKLA